MNSKFKIQNSKLIKLFLNLCLSVFICGLISSSVLAQNDGSEQNQTGKAGTSADNKRQKP